MRPPDGKEHTRFVRNMFGRIAQRYDLLNRLMTFGQDMHWRREAVRGLEIPSGGILLDAGCGTGDIAFEALRQHPAVRLIAFDFTPEMLAVGRKRPGEESILWVVADARALPFATKSFDGIISGFLLRNVSQLEAVLHEQQRVLQDTSLLVTLDTTPPHGLLRPFLLFYLRWIIPLLGRLVAGDAKAYTYLPESTEAWLDADRLAEKMRQTGFIEVSYVHRMLGTVAIHWGKKQKQIGA